MLSEFCLHYMWQFSECGQEIRMRKSANEWQLFINKFAMGVRVMRKHILLLCSSYSFYRPRGLLSTGGWRKATLGVVGSAQIFYRRRIEAHSFKPRDRKEKQSQNRLDRRFYVV